MTDAGDAIELEVKSDRELLLLVASKVNDHTRTLEAIKKSVVDCPVCADHDLPTDIKVRIATVERRLLYIAAGTVILAGTSLSPEAIKAIGALGPWLKIFIP